MIIGQAAGHQEMVGEVLFTLFNIEMVRCLHFSTHVLGENQHFLTHNAIAKLHFSTHTAK